MRTKRAFKNLSHVCRVILALTFIFSGVVKTVDPWGTALKVSEYLTIYGWDSLQEYVMPFSIWLCGAELMMGLMLLFKVRIRLISIFAVCSMIIFTVITLLSATVLPVEDCGCFGEAMKLTPWQTFLKNLVLLPLAVVVWWRYRPDRIFSFSKAEVFCTVLFFSLAMGLGTYCYYHLPVIDFLPYKVGTNIYEVYLFALPFSSGFAFLFGFLTSSVFCCFGFFSSLVLISFSCDSVFSSSASCFKSPAFSLTNTTWFWFLFSNKSIKPKIK